MKRTSLNCFCLASEFFSIAFNTRSMNADISHSASQAIFSFLSAALFKRSTVVFTSATKRFCTSLLRLDVELYDDVVDGALDEVSVAVNDFLPDDNLTEQKRIIFLKIHKKGIHSFLLTWKRSYFTV